MRKIVIHQPGGYDALKLEEHSDPRCGPEEVRIAVEAIGVNYADCIVRMGLYKSARELVGWPITPGFEVAGTIAEIGELVEDWSVGDRVLAVTRFGGYATQVCVPHWQAFALPPGWTSTQAAGFPTAFLTAHHALVELARPRAGETILVHSAAGGVGGAMVQVGRLLGCQVVGVVGSTHKIEVARQHGAHAVIDASRDELWPQVRRHAPAGYDVILDANGVATLGHSYRHLAPRGRLVIYGFATMLPRDGKRVQWWRLAWNWWRTPRFNPLELTNLNRSVLGFNLSYLFGHRELLTTSMARLETWASTGALKPSPTTEVSFADVKEAHRALETGSTVGKLVLCP